MQALILAAGMGKRLKKLTENHTKCMVKVNDKTIIERMLSQLEKKDLKKIIIVIGYEGEKLKEYIKTLNIKTKIEYIENKIYYKTNNIYSLSLAKKELCKDDTLLLESDLVFEEDVLDEILNDSRDTLALVDKYQSWMDGTCIKITSDDMIESFIPGKKLNYDETDEYYKTVNIYKFSKKFSKEKYVPFLEAYQKALGLNEYYEQVLRVITNLDNPGIKAKRLNGQLWYEIDDIQDLNIAESIFIQDEEEKIELFQERYGGYWRYPKLLDFCYLINPYYPKKRMINEMKASFEKLLTQYPSGMKVNSLLASKTFSINKENIVVGNGAAELIKSVMEKLGGKTGFIKPSFDEYSNRYEKNKSIYMNTEKNNYSYSKKDIITFFNNKDIDNLIIINPDNPSGNYISKKDIIEIVDWSKKKGINLIVDESFIDFSDEIGGSIMEQDFINKYNNLYIVKSISKSYGVPGLRLGILVSSDEKFIEQMKKDVAIWNINSFAEFYLQIAEKYKNDYEESLVLLRQERVRMQKELSKIKKLNVHYSQANYFMIELLGKESSRSITKKLLTKYNIFIKDLSKKTNEKNFIRVAIRNTEENNKLIYALKDIIK